jgi:hypothetical protein
MDISGVTTCLRAGIRFADNISPPNEWIGLSDSVTEPARVNAEFDMLPRLDRCPLLMTSSMSHGWSLIEVIRR